MQKTTENSKVMEHTCGTGSKYFVYFEVKSFILHFHEECFHSSNISEFDTLSRENGGIRQSNE